ncbi:MAG TPA: tRNA dihydrouridine synthase DusB [Paenalcaligenes sp.]|nr:tRNA dihydrouridine synthase DusB [Paenalcaligenes sp.]
MEMQIGPWKFSNRVFVAPMAGVTDRPYRRLCKALGAEYAVSEMAASNPQLWDTVKTSRRLDHEGEPDPIAIQLTGADPDMMAEAAKFNIDRGAQIIDINMGCPARKVCHVLSGSGLLTDLKQVGKVLDSVVAACQPHGVPVTLKTRTGWDQDTITAPQVAQMAQDLGIAAITIHGRTRNDFYKGQAEYDTIAAVKQNIDIPVIANGDIDSPEKAQFVLQYTGADAVMIGRAAQGRPWIFHHIHHYLTHGEHLTPPTFGVLRKLLIEHLVDHHAFYGEFTGVRTARKHIAWYFGRTPHAKNWLRSFHKIESSQEQLRAIEDWFAQQDPDETIAA